MEVLYYCEHITVNDCLTYKCKYTDYCIYNILLSTTTMLYSEGE